MPVTPDQPAPYAPTSGILSIVERHRTRGLPPVVDYDVLARAGIPESLGPRTLQALQILDLIDNEGKPTSVLENIRLAPEAEYKQRLGEWLKIAYADALTFIDPAKDDETQVRDAFRSYKPVGQQDRMVSLFMGLFRAAGVAPEKERAPQGSFKTQTTVRTTPSARVARAPKQTKPSVEKFGGHVVPIAGHLPPALAGLLASLPPAGQGWTKADRERFVATFGAVLDFCYPVVEQGSQKSEQEKNAEDYP